MAPGRIIFKLLALLDGSFFPHYKQMSYIEIYAIDYKTESEFVIYKDKISGTGGLVVVVMHRRCCIRYFLTRFCIAHHRASIAHNEACIYFLAVFRLSRPL